MLCNFFVRTFVRTSNNNELAQDSVLCTNLTKWSLETIKRDFNMVASNCEQKKH